MWHAADYNSKPLFRPEAVRYLARGGYGRPLIRIKTHRALLLLGILCYLLLAIGLFNAMSRDYLPGSSGPHFKLQSRPSGPDVRTEKK